MTTRRYQKSQIEDVAEVLATELAFQIEGWPGPVRNLVYAFADLFAADNPRRCACCGLPEGTLVGCFSQDKKHASMDGFNRADFLAACGLESE